MGKSHKMNSKILSKEPNTPKEGDRVKAGGVTWTYKRCNAKTGGRTLLWCGQAFIGYDNGTRRKVNIRQPSVAACESELLRLRRDFDKIIEREREEAARPTVRQAFDQVIERKRKHANPNTLRLYKNARDYHFGGLMDIRLDKLTRDDVQTAVDNEIAGGAAINSVKGYVEKLNAVRRYFGYNSFVQIGFREYSADVCGEERDKHYLLPPEQILKAAAAFGDDDFLIFVTLGCMSLRCAEIRGLKYSDIYERDGRHYIHIHAQRNTGGVYIQHTKTACSTRDILLDEGFYKALEPDTHFDEEYLCPMSNTTYSNRMRKLKTALNVPDGRQFTTHTLRHVFKTFSDPDGRYYFAQHICGGWELDGGVAERVYHGRDNKICDEFMTKYYERLFGDKPNKVKITVTTRTA